MKSLALALALAAAFPVWSAGQERGDAVSAGAEASHAVEVLAEAISLISSMHMTEFSDSALWEGAINGLIETLNDPYAELLTPRETEAWTEATTGNYSGIGLQITPLNERVTVTAIFQGTPAEQAGILLGDRIVGVNGHDASEWTTGMAADSIRGPVGTDVVIRVSREGYLESLSFNITRAEVHVPAVRRGMLRSGIGYVALDRVARGSASEMAEALEEFENARGLVVDLRGNPGGYLDESLMLADLFLERGSLLASWVTRVPGNPADVTDSDSFRDRSSPLVPELPVVVLVDRFTASGAEILAGALQDHDRAPVLGERSFGKGVVQTVMDLPHGRQLRFTTGSWQTPLGRSLHRARDSQGRPLAETNPPRTVTTKGGRELVDGGGIIPDIEIDGDTLTLLERRFIGDANDKDIPLGVRLSETGLAAATARQAEGEPPMLSDDEFADLVERLVEDGASQELLAEGEVLAYLRWRADINAALRMANVGAQIDIAMTRDPVLTEAVRLILDSGSREGLLLAVMAGKG